VFTLNFAKVMIKGCKMARNQASRELPLDQVEVEQHNMKDKLQLIANSLPHFEVLGEPQPLSGGLLNFVWRINGQPGSKPMSVIAKWAPPRIATLPEVRLDPDRLRIEASALAEFGTGGLLSELSSEGVRPPCLIKFLSDLNLLIMEDVCDCHDLGKWIKSTHANKESKQIGVMIGNFIGRLHRITARQPNMQIKFNNPNIQRTRLDFQYKNVVHYAEKANLPHAQKIGEIAVAYGELLQEPGIVLIMGDLWLPSIFVTTNGLRIIDWELSHFGRPSQDIGHLVAHLWMHQHRFAEKSTAKTAKLILGGFLAAYRSALGDSFDEVFGLAGVRESAIHFGSEVLTRTVGNFQNGYLYEGLPCDHPLIQEAAACAAKHILDPLEQPTFDGLNWRNT